MFLHSRNQFGFFPLGFDWKRKAVEPGAVPEVLERSTFSGVGGMRTRTPELEAGGPSDPLSGPHQDESKSYSFVCIFYLRQRHYKP